MNLQSLKAKSNEMKAKIDVLFLAFKHIRTPWYAKVLIGLVISYAVSPIDLIPDFIPILGYLDDLILIPAGIALAIRLIPDDIMSECKEKQKMQPDTKKYGIYAGIIIVAIYFILLYYLFGYLWPA